MKQKLLSFALAVTILLSLTLPASAMNECVFTAPGTHNVISGSGDYYTVIDADNFLWGRVAVSDDTGYYQSFLMRVAVDIASVSISDSFAAIVKTDGSLWTTERHGGESASGSSQGKNDSDSPQDLLIKVMDDVASVSCGDGHIAAVKTDGTLWMWGSNYWGQLGNGGKLFNSTTQDTPVKVMDNVVSVSCGADHTAAVKTDGSLWIWGGNRLGQLGTGDYNATHAISETVPVKILDDVAAVCCGSTYTAAIKKDGSLWMWGWNYYGQLGISGSYHQTVAVPTKVLDGVVAVSCSDVTTAAIKTDGSLWISGVNTMEEWQTGEGVQRDSYEELLTPTKVAEGIMAVYCCGEELIIAIKADGSMIGYQDILSDLPDGFVVMLPDGGNKTQPSQSEPPAAPAFTDVPAGSWYAAAVSWAVDNNVTNGTGNNQFSPSRTCTHAEILTFLYRADRGKGEASADDMTKAVSWAREKGMIDDAFDGNKPCTRADAVNYIWQALGKQSGAASNFADVPAEAVYASAVDWAVEFGITDGTGNNQFSPGNICNRGTIATFLYRAYVPEARLK